jgi:hypothetical protein
MANSDGGLGRVAKVEGMPARKLWAVMESLGPRMCKGVRRVWRRVER